MTGRRTLSMPTTDRGQSDVVGVALLLGMTVLALGGLTAAVGAVVEANAAAADADRVAAGFDAGLRPVEVTGPHEARLSFTGGELRTVSRDLRLRSPSGTVERLEVDGLVYERHGHRVAAVAGAIVRGRDDGATMYRPPPITASNGPGVLVVGAPRLGLSGSATRSGSAATELTLATRVTHQRRSHPRGRYEVAIETTTPAAWRDYFQRNHATVVATDRDFDGDGVGSVVARFPGDRTAHVVVHDMHLEVR